MSEDVGKEFWTFGYIVADVQSGAGEKREYHAGRKDFWKAQKEEVLEKIKKEGIEVDEHFGSDANTSFKALSNYRSPSIQVSQDLISDFDDCVKKMREHARKEQEYDSWFQVLGDQEANSVLKLTHSDWMYFFGK